MSTPRSGQYEVAQLSGLSTATVSAFEAAVGLRCLLLRRLLPLRLDERETTSLVRALDALDATEAGVQAGAPVVPLAASTEQPSDVVALVRSLADSVAW